MLPSQRKLWDKIFKEENFHLLYLTESKFARECVKFFPKKAKILELGCGLGKDAIFFARRGYEVIGVDFSKVALRKARKYAQELRIKNLKFLNLDMSKRLRFKDSSFDIVYANLSLHYFSDKTTTKVFKEIARVLKRKGLLCARCRSIKDPLYGKGKLIEKDMYILDGHIRHFFSESYFLKKLEGKFKIKKLKTEKVTFKKERWVLVKVIAEKL